MKIPKPTEIDREISRVILAFMLYVCLFVTLATNFPNVMGYMLAILLGGLATAFVSSIVYMAFCPIEKDNDD